MKNKKIQSLLNLLKIRYPIIQAPMAGGITTTELVCSVANAGGLGSIGAAYLKPEAIRAQIKSIRQLTDKFFCVNLFTPQPAREETDKIVKMTKILNKFREELGYPKNSLPSNKKSDNTNIFHEQIAVLLEEKVSIVGFTFGIPSFEIINELKKNNIILIGTATTVQEAKFLAEAGCDIIVAQGSEAGGHRGTFQNNYQTSLIGTMALVPQIVDAISVPVIAAGGIMDGRGLVAALSLGAAGVQMGTAFLTCSESGIPECYKKAILNSNEESTVITSVFSGKPARGIKNKFMEELEKYAQDIPEFPFQNELTQDIRKTAAIQNKVDYMSLWAGQATRLNKETSAEALIKTVIAEAYDIIKCNDEF